MAITPQQALNLLMVDPARFLRTYALRIYGSRSAQSGVVQYAISTIQDHNGDATLLRPGRILGKLNKHETQGFRLEPAAQAPNAPVTFPAHVVRMDEGQSNLLPYAPAGPPDILVTSELSGCSFVMRGTGNALDSVGHVKPASDQRGERLHSELLRDAANTNVYGAAFYDSADRTASIIGVRIAGDWKLFAQKLDRKATLQAGQQQSIRSVYRIWPERVQIS
jgi:hypothetical protein